MPRGHFNHTLYLFQKGKVTTFAATGGGHHSLHVQAISSISGSSSRGAVLDDSRRESAY